MRTIGVNQMMSASLYADDAQLDSFTKTLVRTHVEQQGAVVVGEPRVGYHFGQLVHADTCGRELVSDHGETPHIEGECSTDCAIVDCEEADASVVMMRVEVDVEGDPHA